LKVLELVARQAWRLILGFAIIGFVFAAISLRGTGYRYPVEMQAISVQNNGRDGGLGGGGRMSQLSGLASIAQISMPTTQNAMQFELFVESLHSRDLANEIAKDQDLMVTLFGGQWDPATRTWFEPPVGATAGLKASFRRLLGLAPPTPWHAPNGENVQGFLADNLIVQRDPRKEYMVTIKMISYDRDFSIRFLNLLTRTADNRLRERALTRARNYMSYLVSKLATVTVTEHREAIMQALGEQERYAMVASSGTPFAAEVFQSPWASNLPASPSPRQVYIGWVILGALAGFALGYARHRYHARLLRSAWVQRLPSFIRRSLISH